MPLQSINFPPGVQKDNTTYSAEGSWYDADKVRFKGGRPEKIGGWKKHLAAVLQGIGRAIHVWRANNGVITTSYGTHLKLYVEQGGALHDITPLRKTVDPAATDTLASTSGSAVVTITDTGHDSADGDFVTLTGFTVGATGLSSSELNANYAITYIDANSYTISLATNASATVATFGGNSGKIEYEIPIGTATETFEYGWGTDVWGSGTWGTIRATSTITLSPRMWSLDNFGEDLVATYDGSKVYTWDFSSGTSTRATSVTNAPSRNNIALVTSPDRHLVVFGTHNGTAFDALLVRWASQETKTDWTATATNTSGSQIISGGSKIVAAKRAQGQTLVWTDTDLHSMQYTGPPFTFGFQQIASQCGAAGPSAMVVTSSVTYWMGQHSFYVYDGSVKELPSTVDRHVFEDINTTQRTKVIAGLNQEFSEVWWFYPSASSDENDRYVTFNYAENAWSIGTMDRTAWLDREIYTLPLAIKSTGEVYEHETGSTDDGSSIPTYIQSADFDLGEGDTLFLMTRFIPDAVQGAGDIEVTFNARDYPSNTPVPHGPFTVKANTDKVDTRVRARQMNIKVSSDTSAGSTWKLGTPRIDLITAGRR